MGCWEFISDWILSSKESISTTNDAKLSEGRRKLHVPEELVKVQPSL